MYIYEYIYLIVIIIIITNVYTKKDNLFKKRTEITNICRHRSKYKLANCDTID